MKNNLGVGKGVVAKIWQGQTSIAIWHGAPYPEYIVWLYSGSTYKSSVVLLENLKHESTIKKNQKNLKLK